MRNLKRNEVYIIKIWERQADTNHAINDSQSRVIGIFTDVELALPVARKALEIYGYTSVSQQTAPNVMQLITPDIRIGNTPAAIITIVELNSVVDTFYEELMPDAN